MQSEPIVQPAPTGDKVIETNRRLLAFACALALPLLALIIWPVAEMGLDDDWSYIKTAQVLSQTGHLVYNGWATAMLGWQLYFADLFIKLFGFSFTAVRSTTWIIATVTAYLVQRCFVRCGLRQRNATVGTLAVVLSPLYLALTFSFMTDIAGFFSIVVCFYACLRAVQACTNRSALAWIACAAMSSTIFGSSRQIAWLGVLVMVPSAVWLLRHRPGMIRFGLVLYFSCLAVIFACMHWFGQQPYAVPEPILAGHINRWLLGRAAENILRAILDAALFLLPISVIFVPVFPYKNQRAIWFAAGGGILSTLLALTLMHNNTLLSWLPPYTETTVTRFGIVSTAGSIFHSDRLVVLPPTICLLLAAAIVITTLSLIALQITPVPRAMPTPVSFRQMSWQQLGVLVAPFFLAYMTLLLPRACFGEILDRYQLPLLFFAVLVLLRFYQEQVRPDVTYASLLLIALFAGWSIASLHDLFATRRASLMAIAEIQSAGVPRTAIDGGWEFNGWTQIDHTGFVTDPRIRNLGGSSPQPKPSHPAGCPPVMGFLYPAVSPRYALALDPTVCGGKAPFTPVTYKNWLRPRSSTIYVVWTETPR